MDSKKVMPLAVGITPFMSSRSDAEPSAERMDIFDYLQPFEKSGLTLIQHGFC